METDDKEDETSRLDLEMMEEFWSEIAKKMSRREFMNQLSTCKNNSEKIQLIKPFFKWKPTLPLRYTEKFKKSSSRCKEYSDKINGLIDAGLRSRVDYPEVLKMSNMIIAYAEDAGDLALGHLLRWETHWRCLKDLSGSLEELKMAMAGPQLPKYQSNDTGGTQSILNIMYEQTQLNLEQSKDEELETRCTEEIERRRQFTKDMFTLKSPNPKSPSLENFAEIKHNSSRGRHVVINKNVSVGTTILVEKPFVTALYDSFELSIAHCHHCHKKNFRLMPCPNCVFALFCDEKCMEESSSYHRYECPSFPYIFTVLMNQKTFSQSNFFLALKVILSIGPEKLYSMFLKKKNDENTNQDPTVSTTSTTTTTANNNNDNNNMIRGLDSNEIYDSTSYSTILHLHSNFSPTDLIPACIALTLTKILDMNTDFFSKVVISKENEDDDDPEIKLIQFQDFVAVTLLGHFESFQLNAFPLLEMIGIDGIRIEKMIKMKMRQAQEGNVEEKKIKEEDQLNYELAPFGSAIYPTLSLLSHSCNPNVIFHMGLNREIAVVASRPLKAGEELCISYCQQFSDEERIQRQEKLWRVYKFNCDCVACLYNFPTLEQLKVSSRIKKRNKEEEDIFVCPRCLCTEMKSTDMGGIHNTDIILNKSNYFRCGSCKKFYKVKELHNALKQHKQTLDECLELLRKNCPLETIKSLYSAIKFFHTQLVTPSIEQIVGQELQIAALHAIIHFSGIEEDTS